MAIAGKVAITPKGEWNAQTAYAKLDLVFYDNASYVAIQPSTSVEPTNESYWMLMVQSAGGADLEAIISGDIQVGNAKTLDGHEAEYFFPKSGGTINGDVTVKKESGQVVFSFKNGNREMVIVVTESGTCGVLDQTNKVWLWNSELNGTTKFYGHASEDLPLTGDSSMATRTIGRSSNNPLILKNTNSGNNQSYIGFATESHGTMGLLGYIGSSNPVCVIDGTANTLLHTGNKPTGTYTGNGSATSRQIATNGVGSCIMVRKSGSRENFAIVTESGYIAKNGSNVVCGTDAYFASGVLTVASTIDAFNTNGATYYYQVL